VLSPLVRVDVLASHEAVEATQRRQRRQRGRRHLAGRRARCGGMPACGHDRRSPKVESQGDGRMRTGTGPETTSRLPLINSTTWQSRFNGRGQKVLCSHVDRVRPLVEVKADQRIGSETVLSLRRLSASRRRRTRLYWLLNAVETERPARLRGNCHGIGDAKSLSYSTC
jgi:hypothetical protein